MTVKASSNGVRSQSAEELLGGAPLREFIMLAGKDGVGKSSAIVSLAWYVQQVNPDAVFFVLDTENKFKSALRSFQPDPPTNIRYYKVDSMNQVTSSIAEIVEQHKPYDWVAVESLSRVWERAQDLGYQVTSGVDKVEYLERKRSDKSIKSPIPGNPGDFWAIVKGAHDSAFFDLLTQQDDLNVIVSTTVTKAKEPRPGQKESVDRKAIRVELGIDVGLDGAPRLPYYVESLCLLDLQGGRVTCRFLRDNISTADETRIEFEVPTKRDWGPLFFANCRG